MLLTLLTSNFTSHNTPLICSYIHSYIHNSITLCSPFHSYLLPFYHSICPLFAPKSVMCVNTGYPLHKPFWPLLIGNFPIDLRSSAQNSFILIILELFHFAKSALILVNFISKYLISFIALLLDFISICSWISILRSVFLIATEFYFATAILICFSNAHCYYAL